MLNPQLVAGKHGFFGDHESEDIRTIFCKLVLKRVEIFQNNLSRTGSLMTQVWRCYFLTILSKKLHKWQKWKSIRSHCSSSVNDITLLQFPQIESLTV